MATKKSTPRLVKTECSCATCKSACQHTPGWFRPGEADKAAALMGMTLPKFFKRYLAVNWWEAYPENTFVLSPAVTSARPGREANANPRGTCVFFKNGLCQIHAAKPFDCSHGNPHDQNNKTKRAQLDAARAVTVKLWGKKQKQIHQLLGRQPEAATYSFLEAMFW